MKQTERIVTRIPLDELWTVSAILEYKRLDYLTERQVKELVLKGAIAIAEASCGLKLSWILPDNAFKYFKSQIKGRVVHDPDRIILDDYEDKWCYLASLWVDAKSQKVILLETYH
jgi:hypothetical protein